MVLPIPVTKKGEMQNALGMDTSRKNLPVTRLTKVFGLARLC